MISATFTIDSELKTHHQTYWLGLPQRPETLDPAKERLTVHYEIDPAVREVFLKVAFIDFNGGMVNAAELYSFDEVFESGTEQLISVGPENETRCELWNNGEKLETFGLAEFPRIALLTLEYQSPYFMLRDFSLYSGDRCYTLHELVADSLF